MSSCAAGPYPMGGGAAFPTADDLGRLATHLRAAWASMGARAEGGRGGSGAPGRGPWAGGPWGRGGPFGPDFPWPGHRPGRGGWPFEPGRARAGRGDARLAILALLEEGPRHGYQLIQDIRERSHGAWNPSPGSIYPALSALQDEGLIDDEKLDGRRVFSLTPAGRAYAAERADDLRRVFADNTAPPEHEDVTDLRELIWGVGGAALTVIGSGTQAQREQARQILARTRRDLYRILAEDQAGSADIGTDEDAAAPAAAAAQARAASTHSAEQEAAAAEAWAPRVGLPRLERADEAEGSR